MLLASWSSRSSGSSSCSPSSSGPCRAMATARLTHTGALERGSLLKKRVQVRFLIPPVQTRQGMLAKKTEASKKDWRKRAGLRADVRWWRHGVKTRVVRVKRSVHLLLQTALLSFLIAFYCPGDVLKTCFVKICFRQSNGLKILWVVPYVLFKRGAKRLGKGLTLALSFCHHVPWMPVKQAGQFLSPEDSKLMDFCFIYAMTPRFMESAFFTGLHVTYTFPNCFWQVWGPRL